MSNVWDSAVLGTDPEMIMTSSGAKLPSWRQKNSSKKTHHVRSVRNGRIQPLAGVV